MARQVLIQGGAPTMIERGGKQVASSLRQLGLTIERTGSEIQQKMDNNLKMELFNDISEQSNKIYNDNKANPSAFNEVYNDYADNLLKETPRHLQNRVKYELDQNRIRRADQVAQNFDLKQKQVRQGESWTYNLNASNEILSAYRAGNLEHAQVLTQELKTQNLESGLYTPQQLAEMEATLIQSGRLQRVKGETERALVDDGLQGLQEYRKALSESDDIFENPAEKDKALLSVDRAIGVEESRLKQEEQKRKAKLVATKKLYRQEVNGLTKTLQLGYEVDSGYLSDASSALDVLDMPEEQADLNKAITAGSFAKMAPAQRQKELDKLIKEAPSQYTYFKNINTTLTQLEKVDPLTHYQRQGAIELEPIDYNDPQSIAKRNFAVKEVEDMKGIDVPVLTMQEQKQLTKAFTEMSASQKVAVVGQIVTGLGEDSITTLNSLSKKNGEMLALGGQLYMDNAPEVAESIFMGQNVMLNNKEVMPKESEVNLSIGTNLGTAYTSNPLQRKTITAAIKAVYADLSVQEGDLSAVMDEDRMQTATDLVTGGLINYESGQWKPGGQTSTIEPPVRGMTTDAFEDWIDGLTAEDIEDMGGSNMNSKEVIRLLKDEAQIESVRVAGKTYPVYIIKTESGAVGNADGSAPFYLEYVEQ